MATCGACQADNADTAKFCSSCGAALARRCVACGSPVSGRFCSECGTAVDPDTAAAAYPGAATPAATAAPAQRVAERRITSVLFGDLVGFTTLSEDRDPEDVRELLTRYFDVARTIVERYGGIVEKFIGDAVMAVWGVPVAHEDDAERAVRAGLDLTDAVAALGEQVGLAGLAMRVGVVTGEVAVTLGATGQGMVAGDAVNTASRVQAAAAPGRVWVDEQTRDLTAAAVNYEDRGDHELKGKSEPIRLFEVRQVVAAVGGARRVDGLEAPFCGRDRELRLIKELFHATFEERRPRLVAVFGAAGIGKSRLGWELDKYIDGINDLVAVHRGRCLSYGEGVAFWSLAEIVRGRLRILEGDSNDVVVQRLHEGLAENVADPDDRAWMLPRLAVLLNVDDAVAPGVTFARDDLFAAWRTFFERVANAEDAIGALIQIDDLQWADRGLLDFIDHVLDNAQAPIFILTLSRPELTENAPTFASGRRATTLYLEPLPEPSMSTLVDGLVHGLPADLRSMLVERSEGVPLFAVETVRALIDRDAVIPSEGRYVLAQDAADRIDLADRSLPTSLHTLIASRLDGLPADERRVVQDAAVLGLSFSSTGVGALMSAVGDDVDVDAALEALVRKEILAIDSDPRSPERGHYRFVQVMVRTVAYDTLSRRDRKARHLAAAGFLAAEPDADAITAILASHYLDAYAAAGQDDDAAELAARALDLLERAADRARGLGAHAEARRHLDTALTLATDPETIGRLLEASARVALAAGAPTDSIALAERARGAFADGGLDLAAARVLALWGDAHIGAGTGHTIADVLSAAYDELADRTDAAPIAAQLALGVARAYYLSSGEVQASIPWFDRAVVLGEALEDIPFLVSALSSYAGALVLVGRSHMGLGLLRVALDLCNGLDDPVIRLRPLNNLASFLATRDLAAAREYAEAGVAIVRRLRDLEWGSYVLGSAVHVYWAAGDWDAALAGVVEATEGRLEGGPLTALISGYAAAIHEARGETYEVPPVVARPTGAHGDLITEAAAEMVAAAAARTAGDRAAAAAASHRALDHFVAATAIDDDFDLFWLTAIDDQLAIDDVATAQEMVRLVGDAPRGHVSTLLRAMLPWLSAVVSIAAGQDDVEADLVQAAADLERFGAPYYCARVLLDHALWLDAHDRAEEGASKRAAALAIFERLRATRWVERAGGGAAVRELTPAAPAGT